jgi:hypothetical protein
LLLWMRRPYSFQVFPRKVSESRLARDVTRCFLSSQLTVCDDGLAVVGPVLRPLRCGCWQVGVEANPSAGGSCMGV